MTATARVLMIIGALIFLVGGLIYLLDRFNIPLGRLPGDIRYSNENFTCIFPLASMIVISIFLSIVLSLILRILNR